MTPGRMTRSQMTQGQLFDVGDDGAQAAISPREIARRLGHEHPPTREQEEAITAPLTPTVVVAGAGSGKTQTMGLRVAWLVANGMVEPHRVLGLTFTRKAAAELGLRVRRMLRGLRLVHARDPFLPEAVAASLAAGEPTVSTYHSYAAGLLGEHALRLGLEPGGRLVGEASAWQLAADVVAAYDGDMSKVDKAVSTVTGYVLSLAGDLGEHLREVDEVRALGAALREHLESLPMGAARGKSMPAPLRDVLCDETARQQLLPLVEAYRELKRARHVVDHADQVALAARIARDRPEVGALEQERFGAVLLDEYQDTGEAQRVLLTSLFGSGYAVTAVGDPRQSIYGWRGASAGNLERFLADFGGGASGRSYTLSASFRNGERVLDLANAVAARIPIRNVDAARLALVPGEGRGGKGRVEVVLHETVQAEADWVADRVVELGGADRDWGEVAVLARRRSAFLRLETALRRRGVPVEVVGLGGLLLVPEVVDVVSTLRVLADPTAGSALMRLLTGPRWRIGPRDLQALGRRGARLAGRRAIPEGETAYEPEHDVVDERSIVDALDDLGSPDAYSAEGHARLRRLAGELRELRRWTTQPLPDLVAAVARAIGVEVEVAARPGVAPADAAANLDRLVQEAEEFAASGDDPGLPAFLAYLTAAEDQEDGLELDVGEAGADRVQVMTVHAAKGLEWDHVVVVGLTETVFPVKNRGVADWTRQEATLPFALRGDRDELPRWDWAAAGDLAEAKQSLDAYREATKERHAIEERRLAYVAMTRARDTLVCSGYWWDDAKAFRGPSDLLEEARAAAVSGAGEVVLWAEQPDDGAVNPTTAEPTVLPWPGDPLGARREAVESGAALVRDALRAAVEGTRAGDAPQDEVAEWRDAADLLIAEAARRRPGDEREVVLPGALSVTQLQLLHRDPAELARRLRRPMPQRPAPAARRGTRFHAWLEEHWGRAGLLDVDELPGSADEGAHLDEDLVALQAAFRRSEWWGRDPAEVEVPFDLDLQGVLLRGRIDAVFADAADERGGLVDVVDWKTGRIPDDPDEVAARDVQLAAYRLAWHELTGTPLARIRAAFHYVAQGATVRPVDLLDRSALVGLVGDLPARD